MRKTHAQNGDFYSLYLGHKKFHFACHPDLAESILNSQVHEYQKSRLIFDKIMPITGKKGLVQLEGEEWKEMRRITSEVFQKKYLDNYVDVINAYTDELVEQIKKDIKTNKVIDISALMIRYTIHVIIRIVFGTAHHEQANIIAKNFIELNDLCGHRMRKILAFPLIIPTALNGKIKKTQQILRSHVSKLINTNHHLDEWHLLSKLCSSLKDDTYKQTLIQDQMMTFIFAGYETTAASLAFCFYLLAKHQESQQIIRLQVDSSDYTLAVYKEALRLYPPAYMLAREVVHPHQLAGNHLKVGENVLLSVHGIHKHPQFWSNPHAFLPERFLNSDMHKFAYIPFGYGKRVCSGMQLAMREAVIVLEKLLSHFQFSLHTRDELQVNAMVTLHPKNAVNLITEQL